MKFQRLNKSWNAEPNAPNERVIQEDGKLKLMIYMNSFQYPQFNEEDIGMLEFQDCYMYRLGPTNDEGFYRGQCRYSGSGISWGEFYLVEESDWRETFPKDKIIINENVSTGELNHYLFYLRDNTFECIARDYKLMIYPADSKKRITSTNSIFTLRADRPSV